MRLIPDIARGRLIAQYVGNGVLVLLGAVAAAVVDYFMVIENMMSTML